MCVRSCFFPTRAGIFYQHVFNSSMYKNISFDTTPLQPLKRSFSDHMMAVNARNNCSINGVLKNNT